MSESKKIEGNEPLEAEVEQTVEKKSASEKKDKPKKRFVLDRNVFFEGKEMKVGTELSSVPKELEPYVK